MLLYLMNGVADDTEDNPLADWIIALQSEDPESLAHPVARWQETRSEAWLVAALWHMNGPHPASADVLQAAGAVPASSPARATVAFLRVKLLIALDRDDEARQVLAALPDAAGPGFSIETINLLRAERLMLARTLDEFLASAPRTSIDPTATTFDEDAAVALAQRFPLDRLVEAARSPILPNRLRTRVAVAAFTRAVVLDRQDAARAVAPALRTLAPAMAADIDRFMRESTPDARRRAALLLILRTPGMTIGVRGLEDMYSVDVEEPRRDFESFTTTWWCGPSPNVPNKPVGEAASELIDVLYPAHNVPYPSFISQPEREAAEKEGAALDAAGHATRYLAAAALEWARTRPADRDAAEALARIVAGWRRACRDDNDVELSRRSFEALHRLYPGSEWAKRTRYWYK
jgi:hypothetical protein